eukprot:3933279-Rhodomonas_salina.4
MGAYEINNQCSVEAETRSRLLVSEQSTCSRTEDSQLLVILIVILVILIVTFTGGRARGAPGPGRGRNSEDPSASECFGKQQLRRMWFRTCQ